jgi:hypothetical protein
LFPTLFPTPEFMLQEGREEDNGASG